MAKENDPKQQRRPLDLNRDTPSKPGQADTYKDLEKASKKSGFFGKMFTGFQDQIQTSRGSEDAVAASQTQASADDLAIRRAKNVSTQRMIIPEGVIIQGSLGSGGEAEISGRIEGDVSIEGKLFLGPSALITGNVRAGVCKVEGLVEGQMECSNEIDLGRKGRLNADAVAGKKFTVAGQVFGNVATGGVLRLVPTAKVEGNLRTRKLIIEEGASFNGHCSMRPPAQRDAKK